MSPISITELLHRRDRLFGCLPLESFLVVLLRGDVGKNLISASLAELGFRVAPPCFSTVPAFPIVSYTPELLPDPRGFDGSTFSVRIISILSILPWYRRCVTTADRPILVREQYQKRAREKNATDECLRDEIEKNEVDS